MVFDGDEQARPAPSLPLLDALRGLGVDIDTSGLPFTVRGHGAVAGAPSTSTRQPRRSSCPGSYCRAPRSTTAWRCGTPEPRSPSAPHIAMTVAMLREAGVEVDDTTANRWYVRPGTVDAKKWTIEPDLSNAVPFLAAAVVTRGVVRIAGWPTVSVQPAQSILDVLGLTERLCAKQIHTWKSKDRLTIGGSTSTCTKSANSPFYSSVGGTRLTGFGLAIDRDRAPARA